MVHFIKILRKLVSSVSNEDADIAIAEYFPELSHDAVIKLRKDVQDFINGIITENELIYYIEKAEL